MTASERCINAYTNAAEQVSSEALDFKCTFYTRQSYSSASLLVPAQVWVLICTDLMGRGIDFRGVNMVVNYDFPTSAISYIHRVGRTGRAGREGRAVTFFTEDDTVNLRRWMGGRGWVGGGVVHCVVYVCGCWVVWCNPCIQLSD